MSHKNNQNEPVAPKHEPDSVDTDAIDESDAQADVSSQKIVNAEVNAEVDAPLKLDPIAKLEQEKGELFERLQRTAADYHNYMKRSQQNLKESIELAKGDVLKNLIPVLDHFDNALAHEPASEDGKTVFEGMRIVRDELLRVLSQCGVTTIEPAVGDSFDPHLHEALMRQEIEGVEPNQVSMVMQAGYQHGNRTLRPAKVAVAPEATDS